MVMSKLDIRGTLRGRHKCMLLFVSHLAINKIMEHFIKSTVRGESGAHDVYNNAMNESPEVN